VPGTGDLAFDLAAVAARLRELADGGLTRELADGIRRAVAPLPQKIRDGLEPKLPNRYAAELDASIRITQRTFLSPDSTSVTILASNSGSKARKLRRLDSGVLWHEVFGNRKVWREQAVTPGWFTRPCEEAAPEVRDAIDEVLREVAAKAEGRA